MSVLASNIVLASALYRPSLTWGLIALVLAVVVLSGVLTARRERLWWPLALRVIAVIALGWVLLGYSQTQPGRSGDAVPPKLTVLIDGSQIGRAHV